MTTTDTKRVPAAGDKVYILGYKLPDGTEVALEQRVTKVTSTQFTTTDGREASGVRPRRWVIRYGRASDSYCEWGASYGHGSNHYAHTDPGGAKVMTATEFYDLKNAAEAERQSAVDKKRKDEYEAIGLSGALRKLVRTNPGSSTFVTETRRLRELCGDDERFISELMYALAEQAGYRDRVKSAVRNIARFTEDDI